MKTIWKCNHSSRLDQSYHWWIGTSVGKLVIRSFSYSLPHDVITRHWILQAYESDSFSDCNCPNSLLIVFDYSSLFDWATKKSKIQFSTNINKPVVVRRMWLRHPDLGVAGSNPPTIGHLLHIAVIPWKRPPSQQLMCIFSNKGSKLIKTRLSTWTRTRFPFASRSYLNFMLIVVQLVLPRQSSRLSV